MQRHRAGACLTGLLGLASAGVLSFAGCAGSRAAVAAALSPIADDVTREERLLRDAAITPGALACNRENRWEATLKADARDGAADLLKALGPSLAALDAAERPRVAKEVEKLLFWRMVRAVILEGDNHNFGVIPLKGRRFRDAAGVERPVLIFRSGFTPRPEALGSCFRSLLDAGGVRHVVNLFDGDIPAADLTEAEKVAAREAGATYACPSDAPDAQNGYGPWRDQLRKRYDDPAERAAATRAVARLVREQILLPGGSPPRGNLHVHCGGGMHRTGMVLGVVEKCVNGEPMTQVEERYKAHVGWRGPERPGGYEEGNVRFLRDFDCALLDDAVHGASRPTSMSAAKKRLRTGFVRTVNRPPTQPIPERSTPSKAPPSSTAA